MRATTPLGEVIVVAEVLGTAADLPGSVLSKATFVPPYLLVMSAMVAAALIVLLAAAAAAAADALTTPVGTVG